MGDQVYVGGHFTRMCADANQQPNGTCLGGETPYPRAASLTLGGTPTSWNPRPDSDLGITTFSTYPGQERLLVGGAFTHMNGVPAGRFAVFG
jgi:hypothetical protein